jgi:hypothetical protein
MRPKPAILAIAILAFPSCFTANAIRGFSAAETVTITISRDEADPQQLTWTVRREGPGDPFFTSEDTGSASLPGPPPECPTWELVKMNEQIGFWSHGPEPLRAKRSLELTRRLQLGKLTDVDATAPAACQLEIGWFPEGTSEGAMRIREPGGEERTLFEVPRHVPAAEPATWKNLAVAPLLDLVIQPIRALGLLIGAH